MSFNVAMAQAAPVDLLFWATWCPYCKALMPHLQSIKFEHGEDVKILALNFIDEKGDPIAFIRDQGYDFTLLENAEEIADLYNVYGTPGLILVDQDMKIRFNLLKLPHLKLPNTGEKMSSSKSAALLAPYWAAELRKALQ